MATATNHSQAMVECVVCREQIRRGAEICTHCHSPQNWTRHVARWSAVTAAIVGALSLASAAVSLWKIVPSAAKLEALVLKCEKDSVNLGLVNVGDKPGAVGSVELQLQSASGRGKAIRLSPERVDEKVIVEPAKSVATTYVYRSGGAVAPFPVVQAATDCHYLLSITSVDFSGTNTSSIARCDCPR